MVRGAPAKVQQLADKSAWENGGTHSIHIVYQNIGYHISLYTVYMSYHAFEMLSFHHCQKLVLWNKEVKTLW